MGTLKLHNIKHRAHLKDSIAYIFRSDKTESGRYIFGDSGYTPEMVYDTFIETKKIFDKEDGRQAYHYMLTFAETDNVTPDLAQKIAEDFVKKLFVADDYDWAAAIHTDTGLIHAHIIFNSVNRATGYKYRYEKGDWEKNIQKIVDGLCHEHGLETIAYTYDEFGNPELKEKPENLQATNYEKYNSEMKDKADLIRQDIDRYIFSARDYMDFIDRMMKDGYSIREGVSKKFGEYITFKPYGVDKGIRSYRLGNGYSKSDIQERIKNKDMAIKPDDVVDNDKYEKIIRFASIPTITYRRYYAKQIYIARIWKNGRPFNNSYIYKKAVIENKKMIDEYKLIKKIGVERPADIKAYQEGLKSELKRLYEARRQHPKESGEYKALDQKIKEYRFNKTTANRILERLENMDAETSYKKSKRI